MKIIEATSGEHILVDDITYPYLSKFTWKIGDMGYAERVCKDGTSSMHRELLSLKKGDKRIGEHKDRNRLNNQLSNLRISNQSENMMNRSKYLKQHSSKYKGVHYVSRDKKWIAKIKAYGENIYIGSFTNEDLAGEAYNKKALQLFGEFAVLNEVDISNIKNEDIKYRGVHFHSRDLRWVANGKIKGKVNHLGYFNTKREALEARNKWAMDNGMTIQEWREFNENSKTDKKEITETRRKNS